MSVCVSGGCCLFTHPAVCSLPLTQQDVHSSADTAREPSEGRNFAKARASLERLNNVTFGIFGHTALPVCSVLLCSPVWLSDAQTA